VFLMYVRFPSTATNVILLPRISISSSHPKGPSRSPRRYQEEHRRGRQPLLYLEKPGARIILCSSVAFLVSPFQERGAVSQVDVLIPLTPTWWIPTVLSEDTWLIKNIPSLPLFNLWS
jgi:hypothetical protein